MIKLAKYNKTKMVATIGPASSDYKMLKSMVLSGVDVCRINFSHGTHQQHAEVINTVNRINKELNSNVCILADLQGPKLRIGEMENNGVEFKEGQTLIISTEPVVGTAEKISVSYKFLAKDVRLGENVLLDDGKIEMEFIEVLDEKNVKAMVKVGGTLSSNKGFNLPKTDLTVPCLSKKDLKDLEFILTQEVQWIGLSFVRHQDDIKILRHYIDGKESDARIIAKIEKPQAVENLDAIIKAADGLMVARGDLGVEMPMEHVPIIQKEVVRKCIVAAKPVIIATQMMESMISSPTPTRAEANDVANAVIDGADAVMLSGETSVGKYPLKAVQAVQRIVSSTEENSREVYYKGKKPKDDSEKFLSDEICFTAVRVSDHVKAKAIVTMTHSGYAAQKISSYRPSADLFYFSSNKKILKTLNLVWNLRGFHYNKMVSTDQSIDDVVDILYKEKQLIKKGDLVINTASMPIKKKPRTNTLKITEVK
ncbi:MAG: Pyruvate kinase [Bacteroidetes bacterium MED-G17]|nr:MAG: Pyruvate kinase [Bacteroidetes bacterium MED-G17]